MAARGREEGALLEREAELALIAESVEHARDGRGGIVVVEGPAGSGKTALMRQARAEAEREGGVRVLHAVGGELEREFAFGVVRQLFERAVVSAPPRERERLLAGAAAVVAPLMGAAPDPQQAGGDTSFATLHGLYWLAAALAEQSPLLLMVDDAHWADAPSLRFLDFLARRAPELPLLIAVGTRVAEPGAEHELLAALSDAPDAVAIRPGPLSDAAVRHLLAGREAPDEVVGAAVEATGGNPLLLLELVRSLSGVEALSADAVRAIVPSSIARSVERRLDRLEEPVRRIARSLAVLGRPDSELLAEVSGVGGPAVAEALEELRRLELVEDDPPRFTHPLVAAAVAEPVTAAESDRIHHRAAEVLRGRAGADEEVVVVHLLAARPLGEPWVADFLIEAARRANAEGAPDAAMRRLRRALEERPADADERFEMELELGRTGIRAGDPSAQKHLEEATRAPEARVALEALSEMIAVGIVPAREVTGVLRDGLDRLGTQDPDLRHRLMAATLNRLILEVDLAHERKAALEAYAPDGGSGVLSHLTWEVASSDAPAAEVIATAERALGNRPFSRLEGVEHPTAFWAAVALVAADAAELADAAIADAEATALRHRTRLGSGMAGYMRAQWLLDFGSAALAEAELGTFLELWGSAPDNTAALGATAALIRAQTLRGRYEDADRVLAELPPDDAHATTWSPTLVRQARAELRMAQGRTEDALADLEAIRELTRAYGWQRFAVGRVTALHAQALIALGRVEEGREMAEAEAQDAARRGVASDEAYALVALAGAHSGAEAIGVLERAVEAAERSPATLARAVARYELGAALRRSNQRRAAREQLALARDLATRIDATALAERAAEELVVAGGRPRRVAQSGVAALTPSERRTAEHAARGLSNREIAETLFVTRKTVEFTLGNVYSKLGIRSRTQLPQALEGELSSDAA